MGFEPMPLVVRGAASLQRVSKSGNSWAGNNTTVIFLLSLRHGPIVAIYGQSRTELGHARKAFYPSQLGKGLNVTGQITGIGDWES